MENLTKRLFQIAALGSLALLPYSAKAQTPVLDDYLTTKTEDVYHVSVNKTGPVPGWDGAPNNNQKEIPNFTRIVDALNNNYSTSTSLPVRLHIMPGEWQNESNPNYTLWIPSNMQLVGQNASVVSNTFAAYQEGIITPIKDVQILNESGISDSASTITLENLHIKGHQSNQGIGIGDGNGSGAYNILVENCFFEGVKSNPNYASQGIVLSQLVKNVRINNNIFWKFGRDSAHPTPALGDYSAGTKTRNNIFAESIRGMTIYDTSSIDLGTVEDPGNNVFVKNSNENIWAQIGDVNEIPAQLNTWYPIGGVILQNKGLASSVYGNPLTNEEDIKHTITIFTPTPTTPQGFSLESMPIIQAGKEVIVSPFNYGDQRFGYIHPVSAVKDFNLYK